MSGSAPAVSEEKTVVVKGWQPPTLQQPFQPTSSPISLSARFMVISDYTLFMVIYGNYVVIHADYVVIHADCVVIHGD